MSQLPDFSNISFDASAAIEPENQKQDWQEAINQNNDRKSRETPEGLSLKRLSAVSPIRQQTASHELFSIFLKNRSTDFFQSISQS